MNKLLIESFKNEILDRLTMKLNEATLKTIKSNNKFRQGLSDEDLEKLTKYDPELYKRENKEEINSPFIQWLINHFQEINSLDADKVREILANFLTISKTGKIININPSFIKNPNDVMQYRKFSGIEQAVNDSIKNNFNNNILNFDFRNESANEKEEWAKLVYNELYAPDGTQLKDIKDLGLQNDLKKLYSGKTIDVWEPLTWKGSVALRCGSDMTVCIGQAASDGPFSDYINKGLLLYIINKNNIFKNYAISIPYKHANFVKETDPEEAEKLRNSSLLQSPNVNSFLEIENCKNSPILGIVFLREFPEFLTFLKKDEKINEMFKACVNLDSMKDKEKTKKAIWLSGLLTSSEIKDLLKKGMSLNETNELGQNILHQSCVQNNIDAVKFLIDQKMNLNQMDQSSKETGEDMDRSPLYYACNGNNFELAKLLIKNGAAVKQDLYQILFATSSPELANFLLSIGLDPNYSSSWGEKPLEVALMHHRLKIAQLLANNGAVFNNSLLEDLLPCLFEGIPLPKEEAEVCEFIINNFEFESLTGLLERDESIYSKPLLALARKIEKNEKQRTPFEEALKNKDFEKAKDFILKGYDINYSLDFLEYVFDNNEKDIFKFLIKNKMNINALNETRLAPISFCRNPYFTQILLNIGAQLTIKTLADFILCLDNDKGNPEKIKECFLILLNNYNGDINSKYAMKNGRSFNLLELINIKSNKFENKILLKQLEEALKKKGCKNSN